MNESEFREHYANLQNPIKASDDLKNRTAELLAAQESSSGPVVNEAANNNNPPSTDTSNNGETKKTPSPKKKRSLFLGIAAAACLCIIAVALIVPSVLNNNTGEPLDSSNGFAVRAYALGEDRLLETDDKGIIIFDDPLKSDRYSGTVIPEDEDYPNVGHFTGCYFTVEGEGIARIQANISAGALYQSTVEEGFEDPSQMGTEEGKRISELLTWDQKSRGMGEYYNDYDYISQDDVNFETGFYRVILSKLLGSTIDIPFTEDEPIYLGLWTNKTNEGYPPGASFAVDSFEGETLTVTVQFKNGLSSTQVFELHASEYLEETITHEDGSTTKKLKVISEEEIENYFTDEGSYIDDAYSIGFSVYGKLVEENSQPFPHSLDNANELADTTLQAAAWAKSRILAKATKGEFTRNVLPLAFLDDGPEEDFLLINSKDIRKPQETIEVDASRWENQEYKIDEASPPVSGLEPTDTSTPLEISNVRIQKFTQLPEEFSWDSSFLNEGFAFNQKQHLDMLDCVINDDGSLGEGFSYLVVEVDMKNASDSPQKNLYVPRGSFAKLDNEEGQFSYVQTKYLAGPGKKTDSSFSPEDDFFEQFEPEEKKKITSIHIVPDFLIDDPALLFVVDEGIDRYNFELNTNKPQAFAVGGIAQKAK